MVGGGGHGHAAHLYVRLVVVAQPAHVLSQLGWDDNVAREPQPTQHALGGWNN